jgi:hypothetical protein
MCFARVGFERVADWIAVDRRRCDLDGLANGPARQFHTLAIDPTTAHGVRGHARDKYHRPTAEAYLSPVNGYLSCPAITDSGADEATADHRAPAAEQYRLRERGRVQQSAGRHLQDVDGGDLLFQENVFSMAVDPGDSNITHGHVEHERSIAARIWRHDWPTPASAGGMTRSR